MGLSFCLVNKLIITNVMMLILRTIMLIKVILITVFLMIIGDYYY